jgi:site-specific DNA-methyltransferase (adenine-specific)
MLDFGFYNMDCMDGMRQFPDNYFNLAIVDPPYGNQVGKGGYMNNTINGGVAKRQKYNTSVFLYNRPDEEYFSELQRVSKNQIIWGGNYFCDLLPTSQCWIAWDKKKPEGVGYADIELAWTSFDRSAKIFRFAWNGMIQEDMKNKEKKIHPTQKPVALYEWLLDRFAKNGDLILDTHVGSASSLIACEKHGYKYVAFEIDKDYYDQAKERIEEQTAQFTLWQMGYNPYQE